MYGVRTRHDKNFSTTEITALPMAFCFGVGFVPVAKRDLHMTAIGFKHYFFKELEDNLWNTMQVVSASPHVSETEKNTLSIAMGDRK